MNQPRSEPQLRRQDLYIIGGLLVGFVALRFLGSRLVLKLVHFSMWVQACCTMTDMEPRPGSTLKVIVAYFLVSLSRAVRPSRKRTRDPRWLESRHRERSNTPHFNDSFYWWTSATAESKTATVDGGKRPVRFILTSRLGFYGVGASRVVPWLTIDIDGTTYSLPSDSLSEEAAKPGPGRKISASDEEGNELEYECLVPLRQWRLRYKGEVEVDHDRGKRTFLDMDLKLTMVSELFFYQRDWDKMAVAKAMSAEPWSLGFFRALRSEHQEHYEVGTRATGTIRIGAQQPQVVELAEAPGFRDHSFGKRDWTYMHRYMWLGTVTFGKPLEIGGHRYTHMTGTAVHYGHTFKHLVAGGLMGARGSKAPPISFGAMSHMREMAEAWHDSEARGRNHGVGHLVGGDVSFDIALTFPQARVGKRGTVAGGDDTTTKKKEVDVAPGDCPYTLLRCEVSRKAWKHGFLVQDGTFEVHEGDSLYTLQLLDEDGEVAQSTTGVGLLEFGGTLA